jgi:DNA sulfur modification protein DndD
MLRLKRLEVIGFGPFADEQVLELPPGDGVTVVYGENMRGKTSLLNAIRYAFFGTVRGRGSRTRGVHTITNRDRAANGEYGFTVSLIFDYEGAEYELVRECRPKVDHPDGDDDYEQEVMLRRERSALGPQERAHALQQIFPEEISRFFLFDGELLQEYEELLIRESESGQRISEAIERILGVPILKRARIHLTRLSEEADAQAAREATKVTATQGVGSALEQATALKAAHQVEVARKQKELDELNEQRAEIEEAMQSMQKYAVILEKRDDAQARKDGLLEEEKKKREEIQAAMGEAWRSLLREPVRTARAAAQVEAQRELDNFVMSLRRKAIDAGHCGTCDQDVPETAKTRLRETLPKGVDDAADPAAGVSSAMARLADLNKFREADNVGEVRQVWKRLRTIEIEKVTVDSELKDLDRALADCNPETVRRSKTNFGEIVEKIAIAKNAIQDETKKAEARDKAIQDLKRKLAASGTPNLLAGQMRAKVLGEAAEIFGAAVEQYKADLRGHVEETASKLFLSMTTEKSDYDRLTINEGYGLTIIHRDGRAEEARSAGAEHVVALALMGALQHNAPLRGPIVMDSPFGRLDEEHTSNVVETLPEMAGQVLLLVYEAEVDRSRMRELLGNKLLREYQLEHVSARRTNLRQVKRGGTR